MAPRATYNRRYDLDTFTRNEFALTKIDAVKPGSEIRTKHSGNWKVMEYMDEDNVPRMTRHELSQLRENEIPEALVITFFRKPVFYVEQL